VADLGRCKSKAESIVELDRDYGRLLKFGITNSTRVVYGPDSHEAEADWILRIAEPWWAGIRRRAERDGLRVKCFRGHDSLLDSVGVDHCIAAAWLLSPEGVEYARTWTPDAEARQRMLDDWGEKLTVLRERWPYDADIYGQPDGA